MLIVTSLRMELGKYPRSRHGRFIARHPLPVIVCTFLCSAASLVGFINFHWEANAIKLWLPIGSEFVTNYEHLWQTHPPEIRLHQMIFVVDGGEGDILQPEYFRQVFIYLRRRRQGNG